MFDKTWRLATVMTLLWIGISHDAGAKADIVIQTPVGLVAGDTFRIAFVTDATTEATSTDINYYNAFVNSDAIAEAGGVGNQVLYNGVPVTFTAIASTANTNVLDNIGETGAPIYLTNGTLIQTSDENIWDPEGAPLNPINTDLLGRERNATPWTGTQGNSESGQVLGSTSPSSALVGNTAFYNDNGWIAIGYDPTSTYNPLYAISVELTVPTVPEPSSIMMLISGIGLAMTYGNARRRKQWKMKNSLCVRILLLSAAGVAAISGHASAGNVTYVVDPAESSLTAAVYLGGPPSAGGVLVTRSQIGSSDTSSLSGTMIANISGGTISFLGGTITPAIQPYPLLPAVNGGGITGPGLPVTGTYQFGLALNPAAGLGTGYASLGGMALSVTGDGVALSGGDHGTFDSTQASITGFPGNVAWWLNTGFLFGILYGNETPPATTLRNGINSDGGAGYIGAGTVAGDTVTLPVFADAFELLGSGIGVDIVVTGQIVAIASVPEPTTFVLVGLGLVSSMLVFGVRRSERKA